MDSLTATLTLSEAYHLYCLREIPINVLGAIWWKERKEYVNRLGGKSSPDGMYVETLLEIAELLGQEAIKAQMA